VLCKWLLKVKHSRRKRIVTEGRLYTVICIYMYMYIEVAAAAAAAVVVVVVVVVVVTE